MAVQNIFIAGFEKCGTTALADWMLTNGLVEDRVPNMKEPFLYANNETHPARIRTSDLPLLDASVGYAQDPGCVARLPEHDTRIIICLRNPFERLWSAYKMHKVLRNNSGEANEYLTSYFTRDQDAASGITDAGSETRLFRAVQESYKKYFPRRSHDIVEGYLNQELNRIEKGSFASRIEYELGFYLSRRKLPMASILIQSFYYYAIRTVQQKYLPSDISLISVNQLASAEARQVFVEGVFEKSVETSEIPRTFSSAEVEIDEPKPDFNDPQFDLLRACFRYDLAQVRELIPNTRFGDHFLDNADLDRYMTSRPA